MLLAPARLLCVAAVALAWCVSTSLGAPSCGNFARCSECVFDSSDGILSTPLACSWCAQSSQCFAASSAASAACTDIRNASFNPTCPDMQCSAANTTNNIYFCRGTVIAALFFGLVLLFINVMFFGWLLAIWQLPWKYANINTMVQDYITKSGSVLASLSAPPDVGVELKSRAETTRTGSCCPMCKVLQADPLGPGEVCFWCDVARYAFLPFSVGVVGCAVTLVLVFFLPLKPWFADPYYALILTISYVSYALFMAYIVVCRVSIVGDTSQKTTTFFQLAWILRGRKLTTLFPPPKASPPPPAETDAPPSPLKTASASVAPPPKSALTDEFIQARRAETMQLVNLDYLPGDFRKVLHAHMGSDEFIMWWEQPSTSDMIADLRWLIHALVTMCALGVWFWIAASVTDKQYPITRMVDASTLGMVGTLLVLFSVALLLVTLMGCSRMYVLTNKRLMIVAGGVLGAHISAFDLEAIKYASVLGYTEWRVGPMLNFSWETPAELRKMPPIATKSFAALEDVDGFLEEFGKVAPRLTATEVIRSNISHNRAVWRMHMFFNIGCIAVMPIVVLYSQFTPVSVSLFLLLVIWSLNICIIQRGLRHQQITYAPLNLVDIWTRRPDQEPESFLQVLIKDGQFHWMNKPKIHLPSVSEIAQKVREVATDATSRQQREM